MIKPCALRIIRKKYYISIYGEKLLFIDIPIGPQAQQVNVTPDSVRLRMRSFQDRMSNFLAWKIISQIPFPYHGILQLRVSVALSISPKEFF